MRKVALCLLLATVAGASACRTIADYAKED